MEHKTTQKSASFSHLTRETCLWALAAVLALLALPTLAYASTPTLQVTAQSGDNYLLNVRSASPYSYLDLYTREQGEIFWTVFRNLGPTDGNGYYSITLAIGSFHSSVTRESYVSAGGGSSGIVVTAPYGGHSGVLSFSSVSVYLNAGQSNTVSVYGGAGQTLYISSNSNSAAISASIINNSSVSLYGNSSGAATIQVCTYNSSSCGSFTVNVSGGSVGNITFNPVNPNLSIGQNMTVSIYAPYLYSGGYYLSSNSNPGIVSASVLGNIVNLYGNSYGNATLVICQISSSSVCGTLTVNVSYSNSSGLYFVTQNLPSATVGNYYQSQLSVGGGNYPYRFALTGGTLPAGLTLSSSGVISGVPTNNAQYFFTVQAWDNALRQVVGNFSISISGGTVLGSTTYANGMLITQGPTVFIVYRNTKTPFSSAEAFRGLGFDFADIACTNCGYILDSGRVVTTANASHPWGSWVINGSTVYFVSDSGLIPISSYEVFVNNGGQGNLIVPMNGYDANLPSLSVMVYNDMRLR